MASAEIIFGPNIGDRVGARDSDFRRFLAEDVTPRCPDGLTVIDARGQWRDPVRETLIREPSKVVLLTFPDDEPDARPSRPSPMPKARSRQPSVLTSIRTAYMRF